jgi:hypothetical protein
MKISLTLITIILSVSGQNKIDYMTIRDSIRPPLCGPRDSLGTTEVYERLLTLDTNTIGKNLYQYYDDRQEMEYLLCAHWHDTTMMRKSAESAEKGLYHHPSSASCLWSAAFAYGWLGECEKMEYYLGLYVERVKKRYRTSDVQVERLRAHCLKDPDQPKSEP